MPTARFAYLHQAVRAGIQLIPDEAPPSRYFGVSPNSGRLGCDALAAAWFAEFYDRERSEDQDAMLKLFLSVDLASAYPVLHEDMGPGCPSGPSAGSCPHPDVGRALEQKIIHLQDRHRFSREQVADWLLAHGY
jgi:hypothetical protein